MAVRPAAKLVGFVWNSRVKLPTFAGRFRPVGIVRIIHDFFMFMQKAVCRTVTSYVSEGEH